MSLQLGNEALLFNLQTSIRKNLEQIEFLITQREKRVQTVASLLAGGANPDTPTVKRAPQAITLFNSQISNLRKEIADFEIDIKQIIANAKLFGQISIQDEIAGITTPTTEIKPPGEETPIENIIEQLSIEPIIDVIPEEIKKINPLLLVGGAIVAILILR